MSGIASRQMQFPAYTFPQNALNDLNNWDSARRWKTQVFLQESCAVLSQTIFRDFF